MDKTIFLNMDAEKKIRRAYKARKKTIVLDGRTFTIKRRDRKVTFVSGGEERKATEKWLVLNPADGSQLPSGQIELTDGCNLRTALNRD